MELQRHSMARTAKQGESQGLQLGSGTFASQSRRVLDSSSERSTPTAARRAANAGRAARVPCARTDATRTKQGRGEDERSLGLHLSATAGTDDKGSRWPAAHRLAA
jgi:hypothetical protein